MGFRDMARNTSFRRHLLGAAFIALAAAAAPLSAQAQQAAPAAAAQKPVDQKYVWDLTSLFKSDAEWDAARKQVLAQAPDLAKLREGIGKDAKSMAAALETISATNLLAEKVAVYAYLGYSTNTRDPKGQERWTLAQALQGELGSNIAWLAPTVQDLGAEKVEAFIKAEPALKDHAFGLRDILRRKPHTLTKEAEAAVAAFTPVLGSMGNIHSVLSNADIDWPEVEVPDAGKKTVNQTTYQSLRQHPDRATRKAAFDAFWATYGQFANTYGGTLSATVNAGVIDAKLRNYPSAVAASLANNNIPESVYRTLVAEANKGLPTLHRYFKLRQKMLKLPDLHYYDIYPALVRLDKTFGIEDSKTLTLAAMKPLGQAYVDDLGKLVNQRTMHVYPGEGKDSGAYHWGVWGGQPYIFLNHKDDYDGLTTFAHEWGHGMHSHLANKAQPYETSGYSLFLAEIASTANEMFLSDHMVANAKSKEEKLFYLGQALEGLRATFFRQTMFAEFELATHDAVQRGEALSGAKMTEIYCDLLKRYHGDAQGVMKIDPKYCSEWAYISHFYRPFYVYQYATSISAGIYFATQINQGGEKARETYLDVLRAGGSQYPYDLLKQAGLDMASPAPYQALVKRMDAIMDEMEKLM